METTIAHIVIERLNHSLKKKIIFPDIVKGNLMKEHAWAMFSQTGPKLIVNHKDLFENVCKEVDHAIAEGVVVWDGTGKITILNGSL